MPDTVNTTVHITREQEKRLYAFISAACEDDPFRYEMIAKKVGRTADGTASNWEATIAADWLQSMLQAEAIRKNLH